MMRNSQGLLACVLFLTSLLALNTKIIAQTRVNDQLPNPHSDLIFRATGAHSCLDCHARDKTGVLIARPLENDRVRQLRDKAKGIHGPGRYADCLRCHAGGRKGVEKY